MRWCWLAVVLVSGSAFGQLFAVAPGPRLVTVNPDTGVVVEIGDIDVLEGGVVSMEFVGQRLYAVNSSFPNGARLIEIDTHTGSVLSGAELTLGGVGLLWAIEGLGFDEAAGSLVLGFWRQGAWSFSASNTLGFIWPNGVVVSAVEYDSFDDFDGLATRAGDGTMYWVDREPGNVATVEIGVVSHGGAKTSLIVYDFDETLNGVNDVTLAPDRGELLAVDSVTGNVHKFDPGTAALLGSVPYDNGFSLNAAAYRVPCPADFATPFGVLDLADVLAFATAFVGVDPVADLAAPFGLFDLADVLSFVDSFNEGCP